MIHFQLYFVFDGSKLPIRLLCMPSLFLSFIIYAIYIIFIYISYIYYYNICVVYIYIYIFISTTNLSDYKTENVHIYKFIVRYEHSYKSTSCCSFFSGGLFGPIFFMNVWPVFQIIYFLHIRILSVWPHKKEIKNFIIRK